MAGWYNKARVVVDSTGLGDPILDVSKQDGLAAEGIKFTAQSKQELMDNLVLALERRDLMIPYHHELIRELQFYKYRLTPSGNVKLGAPTRRGIGDDW